MEARSLYKNLDSKAPEGKEKHHGNKRKLTASMKDKARRQERHKRNKEKLNVSE